MWEITVFSSMGSFTVPVTTGSRAKKWVDMLSRLGKRFTCVLVY